MDGTPDDPVVRLGHSQAWLVVMLEKYYEDEAVTIWHGDQREFPIMDFDCELLLTDIPYNVSVPLNPGSIRNRAYGKWDVTPFQLDDITKRFAQAQSAYVWCSDKQLSMLLGSMERHGMSTRSLAWVKNNPSPVNGQHLWLSGLEFCAYGKRPKATFNEHCQKGVFDDTLPYERLHPNQKPLSLMQRFTMASTHIGDMVFDPFMGSGTTLRAAKDTGRKAVGIELLEEYCEIAARRMEQEVLAL